LVSMAIWTTLKLPHHSHCWRRRLSVRSESTSLQARRVRIARVWNCLHKKEHDNSFLVESNIRESCKSVSFCLLYYFCIWLHLNLFSQQFRFTMFKPVRFVLAPKVGEILLGPKSALCVDNVLWERIPWIYDSSRKKCFLFLFSMMNTWTVWHIFCLFHSMLSQPCDNV
jgi:hypothetical protein